MAIPVGTVHEEVRLVTSEIAIDFLGKEEARVLSTPHLIWILEMTCRNTVRPFLDEQHDTVGTHVDVKHLAATPIGLSVTARAEIVAVEDRRVRYRVEAFDEREKIAEGTHERMVINIGKFAARVQAKKALINP
jgi:predicted thioesterase